MSRRVLTTIYPLLLLASAFSQALPRLSIADVTVSESSCSSQTALFTVSVSPPYGKDASVEYATANRSAIAGADYTAVSGTLTFLRGSKAPQTISVPIADVLIPGPAKTFVVTLTNPMNAELINHRASAGGQVPKLQTVLRRRQSLHR